MLYKMRTQSSCGPDELGAILAPFGVSQENVDKVFGIRDIGKFADLMDTPAAHYQALKDLGIPFRSKGLSPQDVICGKCQPYRTAVLVHAKDDPKTILPESWLQQHWVIYAGQKDGKILLLVGDGKIPKAVSPEAFSASVVRGGPTNTIYEVGVGDEHVIKPISWFAKLMKWIFGRK